MTPTANLASSEADADHPAEPAAEAGPFVLNLCSSTTPMALAQTELPELKRFTFFVSRRFEEGRERFRLHMGFFASQAEAEEWLGVVRDIYPGAWAGEAPGKKLRARATEAAAAQARHAVGPQPKAPVPTPPAAAPTPPAKAPAAPAARPQNAAPAAPPRIPTLVPTLHPPASPPPTAAAPARTAAAQAVKVASPLSQKRPQGAMAAPVKAGPAPAAARAMPTARATTAPAAPSQARPGNVAAGGQRPVARPQSFKPAPPAATAPGARPKPTTRPIATRPAAPRPAAPSAARPSAHQPAAKPVFANSNVKEVLAALDTPDSTGETRVMRVPALARAEPAEDATLTDTQVLKFLETRRDEESEPAQPVLQADAAESGISLLKPDDTGTRRALKEAVSHNDPVSFAVQLQWSVQPVELTKVPPLAIFSAYTLYSVEGSREGRKWYGLRLGFFNDAISAKQVAYYVRSEFNSVAVVPVSPQERERATEDNQRFAGVGAARKRSTSEDNEFKLIEDETPRAAPAPAVRQAPAAQPAAEAPKPAAATARPAPATRSARKGSSKVEARERRTPQTLEETLEILGANELAIDSGTGESLNDTGVRHLRVEFQKNTPFSRLLERLSERVKKS